MIHEDERRTLEDWPEAKIITAKQDCVLGNHYHKIKTEKFILVKGSGRIRIHAHSEEMKIGKLYTIAPTKIHSFKLKAGSTLIGLCSHPYDKTDDYK